MKRFLNHFGYFIIESKSNSTYKLENYEVNDRKLMSTHKEFLKSLYTEENTRLQLVETKTAQLLAQTGIIFAVMSLFVPLIIDKIDGPILRTSLLAILFFAILFYLSTIHQAAKNLNVINFLYQRPDFRNVLNHNKEALSAFEQIEIEDLLSAIPANAETNSRKASNLLYGYRAFVTANALTGLLSFSLCISLVLFVKEKEPVTIQTENPVPIELPSPLALVCPTPNIPVTQPQNPATLAPDLLEKSDDSTVIPKKK